MSKTSCISFQTSSFVKYKFFTVKLMYVIYMKLKKLSHIHGREVVSQMSMEKPIRLPLKVGRNFDSFEI